MVFDGIGLGGIERVGIDYCKLMLELGHEVDVYNLNPNLNAMEVEIPSRCQVNHIVFTQIMSPEVYSYATKKWWWGKFAYPVCYTCASIFDFIYKIFNKNSKIQYDIAIAFSGHFSDLTFLTQNFIKSKKKLCWLHGALYKYIIMTQGYLNLYTKIRNLVVLVSDGEEEVFHYNKWLNLNITKLYNPTFITQSVVHQQKVLDLREQYGKFILMVARFSYPHKDHRTVIDAIKILNQQYQKDINVVFVGDGESEKTMKNYADNEGIASKVVFAGAQRDVQDYYVASYMLVHASVAGEGLPTVMIEAMAYGKPVVATDSKVGPREILGNDEFGLLCKIKDPYDMAEKINRLLSSKSLYEYYVKQGYSRIHSFKPETIKIQLDKLLRDVVYRQ